MPVGQPVAGVGFVATVITGVGTDDANVLPSAFWARTLKRIVLPTSTFVSTNVKLVAPLMFAQLPPLLLQRIQ